MPDTDDLGSNPTANPELAGIIDRSLSRRRMLGGGAALAAVGFFGGALLERPQPADAARHRPGSDRHGRDRRGRSSLLGFTGIPASTADTLVVPGGYVAEVLVPWGTPLFRHSAPWAPDASNTALEQEGQVGFNHDGMHYFPLGGGRSGSRRGLLVLNHEYTDDTQIYTAAQGSEITTDEAGREKVAKALAAHGVTVVEIERTGHGRWREVRGSRFNRRVTGTTPMAFSGPVGADHPMLASTITPSPRGTLNNCANGFTPWGTYLAAEENWNGYFGTNDPSWAPTELEARYGVSAAGFGYSWHNAEERFDLAKNRNELNHFGWVVEIDPYQPGATPVKRTALGRIKHEGATVTEQDGRIVVYSGDDEDGDYVYKFVGNAPWRRLRAQGRSPLDEGTLYVGRFDEDGSGRWLPLVHGEGPLTEANGWADQADVLIRTRQAADALGATKLHRPEWCTVNAKTGDVFLALTNGSGNPSRVNSERDPNPYGHIVRFREKGNVRNPVRFEWDVFLYAGDPAYTELAGGKVPEDQPAFGSPDGLMADPDGRLWIQTDVSNSSQLRGDRGHDRIGNNQMLVADTTTGEVRRFLTGPRGCEITGITLTPDQRTMFVNVQHPGEATPALAEPTVTDPRAVSNWPDFDPNGRPRPATVVIRKLDGGVIGS